MRIAIGVDFNGRNFRGWQIQQDGMRTVQESLEQAIASVANHPVTLHGAGRTDAGVLGAGMIAHFDTTSVRPNRSWVRGVNTHLPDDIALRWVCPVSDEFHARF